MGDLIGGFEVALTLENLLFALIGCLIGMLVGVLPGIGQSAGMAILIPLTFHLPVTGAVIMLASIFYGAMYGGTITTVLMNVPGESESVATAFDGHPMALQGRAGPALTISAIGSFIGGSIATLGLVVAAIPLARIALGFGPPEYMALMLLGLCLIVALTGRSLIKGLLMAVFGLLLGQVGIDPVQGSPRLWFGIPELLDGLPLLAVIMGFFGLSDILLNAEKPARDFVLARMSSLLPSRDELSRSVLPILRGTAVGFVLGLIPGMVAAVSTFVSYVMEKGVSRTPERFGKGAIEGVAGPETANNAFANASFIPLLALGIPSSAALAILLGAFRIHGVTPGPLMFRDHPDVAWGLIASMFIGNVILLALSLPLVRIWTAVLRIPYGILFGIILAVAMVGMYSVRNSTVDLMLLLLFTVVGYILKKLDYPLAPAILAFVLGRKIEVSLRQSLVMSQGDVFIFATRPLAAVLLLTALGVMVYFGIRQKRGVHRAISAS